ncbi:hypothetical protein GVX76_04465 [[Haemophilus] felis]|nr:hypothetical protein [[Haemophilus] felis]
MNKIFRVIFSKTLGRLIVTSELAKGECKAKSNGENGSAVKEAALKKGGLFKCNPVTFALAALSMSQLVFAGLDRVVINSKTGTTGYGYHYDRNKIGYDKQSVVLAQTNNSDSNDDSRDDGSSKGRVENRAIAWNLFAKKSVIIGTNGAYAFQEGGNPDDSSGDKEAEGAVAVGSGVKVFGSQGTAVGQNATAGAQATAVGADAIAAGISSIAIGSDDTSAYEDKLPVDTIKTIFGFVDANNPSVEPNVNKTDFAGVVRWIDFKENYINSSHAGVGDKQQKYSPTYAKGVSSIAIGSRAIAEGTASLSIGTLSVARAEKSTAVGIRTYVDKSAVGATAIGESTRVYASNSLAIGNRAEATSQGSLAFGAGSKAVGKGSIAIGEQVYTNAALTQDSSDNFMNRLRNAAKMPVLTIATESSRAFIVNANETTKNYNERGKLSVNANENYFVKSGFAANQDQDMLKSLIMTFINGDGSLSDDLKNKSGFTGSDNAKNIAGTPDFRFNEVGNTILRIGNEEIKKTKDKGEFGTSLGFYINNTGTASTAIGTTSAVEGSYSVSLGALNYIAPRAFNTVAIGVGVNVQKENSIAIGSGSNMLGAGGVAIGPGTVVTRDNAVALGYGSTVLSPSGVGVGTGSSIGKNSTKSIAIGNNAFIKEGLDDSITYEYRRNNAISNGKYTKQQVGANGTLHNGNSTVILTVKEAKAGGEASAVAIGPDAKIEARRGIAIGVGSHVNLANSIAVGVLSKTDYTENDLAKSAYSPRGSYTIPVNSRVGVFSVGSKGNERRIINVASGALDSDAVNVAQLKSLEDRLEYRVDSSDKGVHYYAINQQSTDLADFVKLAKREGDYRNYVTYMAQKLTVMARKTNGENINEAGLADLYREVKKLHDDATVSGKATHITNLINEVYNNKVDIYGESSGTQRGIFDKKTNTNYFDNNNIKLSDFLDALDKAKSADLTDEAIAKLYTDAEREKISKSNYLNNLALGKDSIAIGYKAQTSNISWRETNETISKPGEPTVTIKKYTPTAGTTDDTSGLNALAVGTYAKATGKNSSAIGRGAEATKQGALSFGYEAKVQSVDSLAIGVGAEIKTQADKSVAIGKGALVGVGNKDNSNSVAVGFSSQALGLATVAVGKGATANSKNSIAIGTDATATESDAIAIGNKLSVYGNNSILLGSAGSQVGNKSSDSSKNFTAEWVTAIGQEVKVLSETKKITNTVAIGSHLIVTASNAVVIGKKAKVNSEYGVAIGSGENSSGKAYAPEVSVDGGIALGSYSNSNRVINHTNSAGYDPAAGVQITEATYNGFGTGNGSATKKATWRATEGALAIGNGDGSKTRQITGVAAGTKDYDAVNVAQLKKVPVTRYFSVSSTATGAGSNYANDGARGSNSIAIGYMASVTSANNAIALGYGAKVNHNSSIAIGHSAKVDGNDARDAVAIGESAQVTKVNAIAIGNSAKANHANSVALGSSSETGAAQPTTNLTTNLYGDQVVINFNGGTSNVNGTVSVGKANYYRTISNVAAGVVSPSSTDAINGSQLYALAITPIKFAGNSGATVNRILGQQINIKGKADSGITVTGNQTNKTLEIDIQGKGGLTAGDGITLGGTITNRLVGTGNVTVKLSDDYKNKINSIKTYTVEADGNNDGITVTPEDVTGTNTKKFKVKLADVFKNKINSIDNKVDNSALEAYAKKDASNITGSESTWRAKLDVYSKGETYSKAEVDGKGITFRDSASGSKLVTLGKSFKLEGGDDITATVAADGSDGGKVTFTLSKETSITDGTQSMKAVTAKAVVDYVTTKAGAATFKYKSTNPNTGGATGTTSSSDQSFNLKGTDVFTFEGDRNITTTATTNNVKFTLKDDVVVNSIGGPLAATTGQGSKITFNQDALTVNNKKISGVAKGVANTDAVNKQQLDEELVKKENVLTKGDLTTGAGLKIASGSGTGVVIGQSVQLDLADGLKGKIDNAAQTTNFNALNGGTEIEVTGGGKVLGGATSLSLKAGSVSKAKLATDVTNILDKVGNGAIGGDQTANSDKTVTGKTVHDYVNSKTFTFSAGAGGDKSLTLGKKLTIGESTGDITTTIADDINNAKVTFALDKETAISDTNKDSTKVATTKAVKDYVDAQLGAQAGHFEFVVEDNVTPNAGSITVNQSTEITKKFAITGHNNIETKVSGRNLEVHLSKNVNLTEDGSLKLGDNFELKGADETATIGGISLKGGTVASIGGLKALEGTGTTKGTIRFTDDSKDIGFNTGKLTNIAEGTISSSSTDAISGKQLSGLATTVLGLSDPNATTFTAPSFTAVTGGSNTAKNTFKGAIDDLITAANKGLKFQGNDSQDVTRNLGETLKIVGEGAVATTTATSNIKVTKKTGSNDTLEIGLSKDLVGITSVANGSKAKITLGDDTSGKNIVFHAGDDTTGDVTLASGAFTGVASVGKDGNNGLSFNTTGASPTATLKVGGNTLTIEKDPTQNSQKVKITGLADPTQNDGAATKNYVDAQIAGNNSIKYKATNATAPNQTIGTQQTVSLANGFDFRSTENITTSVDANGVVQHSLDAVLNNMQSISGANGNKLDLGASGTVSPITLTVGAGTGQAGASVTLAQDGTDKVKATGLKTIGADDNNAIVFNNTGTGTNNETASLKVGGSALTFTRVDETSGTTTTPKVKISNLANGTVSGSSTDAINGSQLHSALESIKTALGGNSTNANGAIGNVSFSLPKAAEVNGVTGNNNTAKTTINDALTTLDTAIGKLKANATDAEIKYTKNSDTSKKSVKLSDGFNFSNGTNTTAEVDDNGVVKFNLSSTLTGITEVNKGTDKGALKLTDNTATLESAINNSKLSLADKTAELTSANGGSIKLDGTDTKKNIVLTPETGAAATIAKDGTKATVKVTGVSSVGLANATANDKSKDGSIDFAAGSVTINAGDNGLGTTTPVKISNGVLSGLKVLGTDGDHNISFTQSVAGQNGAVSKPTAIIKAGSKGVTFTKETGGLTLHGLAKGTIEAVNGKTGTYAVTTAQLHDLSTHLGTTVNGDKTGFTAPTFTAIQGGSQAATGGATGLVAPTTFKAAIDDLITAVNKGFEYKADVKSDNTAAIDYTKQVLGRKIDIVKADTAGITSGTDTYSGSNLITKYTNTAGNGKFEIALKEKPEFKEVKLADTAHADTTMTLNPAGSTILTKDTTDPNVTDKYIKVETNKDGFKIANGANADGTVAADPAKVATYGLGGVTVQNTNNTTKVTPTEISIEDTTPKTTGGAASKEKLTINKNTIDFKDATGTTTVKVDGEDKKATIGNIVVDGKTDNSITGVTTVGKGTGNKAAKITFTDGTEATTVNPATAATDPTISVNNARLTNVAAPTDDTDAANKKYVDDKLTASDNRVDDVDANRPFIYKLNDDEVVRGQDGKLYKEKDLASATYDKQSKKYKKAGANGQMEDVTALGNTEVAKVTIEARSDDSNKPLVIGNIASALGLDNVQTGNIGGSTAITADKAKTAMTTLLAKTGADLTKAVTLADLQAVAQAGLDFSGNFGTVHRTLGSRISIVGNETISPASTNTPAVALKDFTEKNVVTEAKDNKVIIKLAKRPEFTGIEVKGEDSSDKSLTEITPNGLTVANKEGEETVSLKGATEDEGASLTLADNEGNERLSFEAADDDGATAITVKDKNNENNVVIKGAIDNEVASVEVFDRAGNVSTSTAASSKLTDAIGNTNTSTATNTEIITKNAPGANTGTAPYDHTLTKVDKDGLTVVGNVNASGQTENNAQAATSANYGLNSATITNKDKSVEVAPDKIRIADSTPYTGDAGTQVASKSEIGISKDAIEFKDKTGTTTVKIDATNGKASGITTVGKDDSNGITFTPATTGNTTTAAVTTLTVDGAGLTFTKANETFTPTNGTATNLVNIGNVATPTTDYHAVNKKFVDEQLAGADNKLNDVDANRPFVFKLDNEEVVRGQDGKLYKKKDLETATYDKTEKKYKKAGTNSQMEEVAALGDTDVAKVTIEARSDDANKPLVIGNIASALGLDNVQTDNIGSSTAIGEGKAKTAMASLLSASGASLTKAVTLADLQAVAQAGLDFSGNFGTVHRTLGSRISIVGNETISPASTNTPAVALKDFTEKNVVTEAKDNKVIIKLAKRPEFTGIEVKGEDSSDKSLTEITPNGLTVANKEGEETVSLKGATEDEGASLTLADNEGNERLSFEAADDDGATAITVKDKNNENNVVIKGAIDNEVASVEVFDRAGNVSTSTAASSKLTDAIGNTNTSTATNTEIITKNAPGANTGTAPYDHTLTKVDKDGLTVVGNVNASGQTENNAQAATSANYGLNSATITNKDKSVEVAPDKIRIADSTPYTGDAGTQVASKSEIGISKDAIEFKDKTGTTTVKIDATNGKASGITTVGKDDSNGITFTPATTGNTTTAAVTTLTVDGAGLTFTKANETFTPTNGTATNLVNIGNVATPTTDYHAVNKKFVDEQLAGADNKLNDVDANRPFVFKLDNEEVVRGQDGKLYKKKDLETATYDKTEKKYKKAGTNSQMEEVAALGDTDVAKVTIEARSDDANKPLVIGNIASALGLDNVQTDNIGSSTAIGEGKAKTAMASLLSASGASLTKAVTLADLQAVAQAGLDFSGNFGTVHRTLGSRISIVGNETISPASTNTPAVALKDFTEKNVVTEAKDNKVIIKLAKRPEFTGIEVKGEDSSDKSLTEITPNGLTVANKEGEETVSLKGATEDEGASLTLADNEGNERLSFEAADDDGATAITVKDKNNENNVVIKGAIDNEVASVEVFDRAGNVSTSTAASSKLTDAIGNTNTSTATNTEIITKNAPGANTGTAPYDHTLTKVDKDGLTVVGNVNASGQTENNAQAATSANYGLNSATITNKDKSVEVAPDKIRIADSTPYTGDAGTQVASKSEIGISKDAIEFKDKTGTTTVKIDATNGKASGITTVGKDDSNGITFTPATTGNTTTAAVTTLKVDGAGLTFTKADETFTPTNGTTTNLVNIDNVATPTTDYHAVNKKFVDEKLAGTDNKLKDVDANRPFVFKLGDEEVVRGQDGKLYKKKDLEGAVYDKTTNTYKKKNGGTTDITVNALNSTEVEKVGIFARGEDGKTNALALGNIASYLMGNSFNPSIKINKTEADQAVAKLLGIDVTQNSKDLLRAATIADLQAVALSGLNFAANSGDVHRKLGEKLYIVGNESINKSIGNGTTAPLEAEMAKYDAKNIVTEAKNDKIIIKMAKRPEFEGIDVKNADGTITTIDPGKIAIADKDGNESVSLAGADDTEGATLTLGDKNGNDRVTLEAGDDADSATLTLKDNNDKDSAVLTAANGKDGAVLELANKDGDKAITINGGDEAPSIELEDKAGNKNTATAANNTFEDTNKNTNVVDATGSLITKKDDNGGLQNSASYGVNGVDLVDHQDGSSTKLSTERLAIADGDNNSTVVTATTTSQQDKDGNTNVSTATSETLTDTDGNTNVSTAKSNTLKDGEDNQTEITATGVGVQDAEGNTVEVNAEEISLSDTDGYENTTTASGTNIVKRDPNSNLVKESADFNIDGVSLNNNKGSAKLESDKLSFVDKNLKESVVIDASNHTIAIKGDNGADGLTLDGKERTLTGLKDLDDNSDGTSAANKNYVDDKLADAKAGQPFEYYLKDGQNGKEGEKVVRGRDGKLYKESELNNYRYDDTAKKYVRKDGSTTEPTEPTEIPSRDVIVKVMPKEKPVVVGNVASGIGMPYISERGIQGMTSELGKARLANEALYGLKGNALNNVATVGDLQAVAFSGLSFKGNDISATKEVHRKLGETLVIKGEEETAATPKAPFESAAGNIYVDVNDKALIVKLAKAIKHLDSLESDPVKEGEVGSSFKLSKDYGLELVEKKAAPFSGSDVITTTNNVAASGSFVVEKDKDGNDKFSTHYGANGLTTTDHETDLETSVKPGAIDVSDDDDNSVSITPTEIAVEDADGNSNLIDNTGSLIVSKNTDGTVKDTASYGIGGVRLTNEDGSRVSLNTEHLRLEDENGATNIATATTSELADTEGNTNTSTATSNTLKDNEGNETRTTAEGLSVSDSDGNSVDITSEDVVITDNDGHEATVSATGTSIVRRDINTNTEKESADFRIDGVTLNNEKGSAKLEANKLAFVDKNVKEAVTVDAEKRTISFAKDDATTATDGRNGTGSITGLKDLDDNSDGTSATNKNYVDDKLADAKAGQPFEYYTNDNNAEKVVRGRDDKLYKEEELDKFKWDAKANKYVAKDAAANPTLAEVPEHAVVIKAMPKSKAMSIGNVASGIGPVDGALTGRRDAAISKLDADKVVGKLQGIDKAADLNKVATVGDLQAVAVAGLNVAGNDNNKVSRKIGETLKITGEGNLTGATAANNIRVDQNAGKDGVEIKLAANLKDIDSIESKAAENGKSSFKLSATDGLEVVSKDANGATITSKVDAEGTTIESTDKNGNSTGLASYTLNGSRIVGNDGNEAVLNKDGLEVTTNDGASTTVNGDEISVTDKDNNEASLTSKELKLSNENGDATASLKGADGTNGASLELTNAKGDKAISINAGDGTNGASVDLGGNGKLTGLADLEDGADGTSATNKNYVDEKLAALGSNKPFEYRTQNGESVVRGQDGLLYKENAIKDKVFVDSVGYVEKAKTEKDPKTGKYSLTTAEKANEAALKAASVASRVANNDAILSTQPVKGGAIALNNIGAATESVATFSPDPEFRTVEIDGVHYDRRDVAVEYSVKAGKEGESLVKVGGKFFNRSDLEITDEGTVKAKDGATAVEKTAMVDGKVYARENLNVKGMKLDNAEALVKVGDGANAKYYRATDVVNGQPKSGVFAVNDVNNKEHKVFDELADLKGANANSALTVDDARRLGFVVATRTEDPQSDEAKNNNYSAKVQHANKLEVVGGNNIEVIGVTKGNTREIKVSMVKDPNFESIQLSHTLKDEQGNKVGKLDGAKLSTGLDGDLYLSKVARDEHGNLLTDATGKPILAPVAINGVADGIIAPNSKQAVNGGQLYDVKRDLQQTDRRLSAGIAGALAVAGLTQNYSPGGRSVSVAGGSYNGQNAVAFGVSATSDNGRFVIKAAATQDSSGKFGGNVGFGYHW